MDGGPCSAARPRQRAWAHGPASSHRRGPLVSGWGPPSADGSSHPGRPAHLGPASVGPHSIRGTPGALGPDQSSCPTGSSPFVPNLSGCPTGLLSVVGQRARVNQAVVGSDLRGHVPLLQPTTHVWGILLLMLAAAAEAQPQAARGRIIVLAANPGAPPPEVLVAAGRRTHILFDGQIEKGSVQVDLARVTLVDVGERSLLIEPVVSPGDNDRWVLRVRFSEGGPPEWAALALVSRPGESDAQVEVVRQPLTLESCQAELARAQARAKDPGSSVWWLLDRLRGSSVQGHRLQLKGADGWAYRFEDGLLFVVQLKKGLGPQPWTPTGATLRNPKDPKQEVKVHALHVREGPLAPGEWSPVAVEASLPSSPEPKYLVLELRGAGGQRLAIGQVGLPSAPSGQRPGQ